MNSQNQTRSGYDPIEKSQTRSGFGPREESQTRPGFEPRKENKYNSGNKGFVEKYKSVIITGMACATFLTGTCMAGLNYLHNHLKSSHQEQSQIIKKNGGILERIIENSSASNQKDMTEVLTSYMDNINLNELSNEEKGIYKLWENIFNADLSKYDHEAQQMVLGEDVVNNYIDSTSRELGISKSKTRELMGDVFPKMVDNMNHVGNGDGKMSNLENDNFNRLIEKDPETTSLMGRLY